MSLVVENGTGLSNAESYLSVADADVYHAARGNPVAWSGATTAEKETALLAATEYIDSVYRGAWKGTRAVETQALSWPRVDAYDSDDFLIDSGVVPLEVERATAELALRALSAELMPDISEPGSIKRERLKAGPVETETEYQGGKSQVKEFRKVDLLLGRLLAFGVGEIRMERG